MSESAEDYRKLVVAIDFDDTITMPSPYPITGNLNPIAKECMIRLHEAGVCIAIWTAREGEYEIEARRLINEWGLPYDSFNDDIYEGSSRKIKYDYLLDDRAYPDKKVPWEEMTDAILREVR